MEPLVLTDEAIEPNDEIVFSYIGEKSILWKEISDYLQAKHPEIKGEWRYYKDGKSWLYRGLKKEKVVYWVGVFQDFFRVTFYLSNKAETLIEDSDISPRLKEEFAGTIGQKFRNISIPMQSKGDVEDVKKLIEIKLKLK